MAHSDQFVLYLIMVYIRALWGVSGSRYILCARKALVTLKHKGDGGSSPENIISLQRICAHIYLGKSDCTHSNIWTKVTTVIIITMGHFTEHQIDRQIDEVKDSYLTLKQLSTKLKLSVRNPLNLSEIPPASHDSPGGKYICIFIRTRQSSNWHNYLYLRGNGGAK